MTRVSAGIFLALVASLLVGARFGYVWAGGEGYEPNLAVRLVAGEGIEGDRGGRIRPVVEGDVFVRGERIMTGDAERALVQIGKVLLALDERTDVVLERTNASGITLRLVRGRIVVVADPSVEETIVLTNKTESGIIEGALSVVNYDFQQAVQVVPIGTVAYVLTDAGATLTTTPVFIQEADPITIEDSTFDPTDANIAAFYQWAEDATDYQINQ